jgi:hypothetical protein
MADEANTTETKIASEGEPAKPETPAPDSGRDGASKEPDYKRMYLDGKGKIEEANRILREREQRDPEPAPAATGKAPRAEDWAAQGDDVAARLLQAEQNQILFAELTRMRLDGMTGEEEQKVLDHFRANRYRLGDLKAARAELLEPTRTEEIASLKEKLRLAEVNKPDPNVIRTAEREVTASRMKGTISRAQFDKDQKNLTHMESLKQQQALLDGALRLED